MNTIMVRIELTFRGVTTQKKRFATGPTLEAFQFVGDLGVVITLRDRHFSHCQKMCIFFQFWDFRFFLTF